MDTTVLLDLVLTVFTFGLVSSLSGLVAYTLSEIIIYLLWFGFLWTLIYKLAWSVIDNV